jgi:protein required for attachment to host cells
MMNDTTWIVVADGGRARFFEAAGLTFDLQEIEDLDNAGEHTSGLTEKDAEALARDERAQKEREKFATRVAAYLEQGREHQRYARLVIAAESRFLGMVSDALSEETRRLIFERVSEDLSKFGKAEIRARLKKS